MTTKPKAAKTASTTAAKKAKAPVRKYTDGRVVKGHPVSFLDAPRRMNELWPWVCAFGAFDYGDPLPLAGLIRSEPLPPEMAAALADVVSGARKPNRRAAAKLKVTAAERLKIAGSISSVLGLINTFRFGPAQDSASGYTTFVEEWADGKARADKPRRSVEVVDVVRELQAESRTFIEESADDIGVSIETIEDLIRDLRARIERWPVV